jgi:DNA-binding CsgD family transcriptional regulator
VLGRALVVRGVVDPGSERLRFIEDGVAVLEHTQATLELARATIELGIALRRARRRRESRDQLVRGADLAHRCGAEVLAELARAQLVSAGARPRRAAFSGVASLTVSELRVARLAAAGMTNRAIALELIVSAKTVSGQLAAAYRKLDVHDRAALAIELQQADHSERVSPERAAEPVH